MKNTASQDNVVAYAAVVVVIAFAVAFSVAWYYNQNAKKNPASVAYASFGPFRIQSQGYAFRASIAIQTQAGNEGWAEANKANFDNIFQKVLAEIDPTTVLAKDGLQPVQNSLKDAINSTLNTNKVQAVLVTDFLMVTSDD